MANDETLHTLGATPPAVTGLLPPGRLVAGYRIEDRIGAGGMGVVYRAVDVELGRPVALKVIQPDFARDERFRQLFKEESRKAAALEHPNIIPIYRSGDEDGLLYIAMRYVDGVSLKQLIDQRGRLPVGAAVRVVAQVADALDVAHASGLIHRDVKPANILVSHGSAGDHVYLTDFGVSVRAADQGVRVGAAGTPAFSAPEQLSGQTADARTDVYALGCVLFQALTGRVPFPTDGFDGTGAPPPRPDPPSVTALVPGLPSALDEVVRTALAPDPQDRYPTAGDLADAAQDARSDVILCHHAEDAPAAGALAERLASRGIDTRLSGAGDGDRDLRSARACLLLVGRRDLGEWATDLLAEADATLSADPRYQLSTVLLPGAPEPFTPGLAFLASRPFVDLRAGLDDPDITADLLRVIGAPAPASKVVTDTCPYRGLEAFQEDDADLFHGRAQETASLAAKLRASRFVAVLGASGSGKSSLVRAGLLPELRRHQPITLILATPGARPLKSLAAQLESALGTAAPSVAELAKNNDTLASAVARLAADRPDGRVVIVIDQFEETFSLNPPLDEQAAFIDNLVYAATIPGGAATVVLAMRSDFYHRCADHPALRALIADQQFLVGPMSADGLRQAIEGPAHQAGLELERGLVRRILADVADQPGALPLMEHLLVELWKRRRGRLLTLEAYGAAGGVGGALAQHADDEYAELNPGQQSIAQAVLLRLTQPGEGTEDTRRRALLSELATSDHDADAVKAVVDRLAAARLVVVATDAATGEPAAEVTHEALIRGWPRLRAWIDADRDNLRLHRRLTDASMDWHTSGRDDSALYRGARLAAWDERPTTDLNERERAFLDASRTRADVERAKRKRGLQTLVGAAAVAAAAVATGAGVAITKSRDASSERASALSRQLARNSVANLVPDPETAVLLAQAAYRADPTPQAEEALRQTVHESRIRGAVRNTGTPLSSVALVEGGTVALGGEDGTLRTWDTTADPRGQAAAVVGKWPAGITRTISTPLGRVTGGPDGAIVLWPAGGGQPRAIGKASKPVTDLRSLPDPNQVLVATEADVRRWDLRTGRSVQVIPGFAWQAVALAAGSYAYVDSDFGLHLLTPSGDRKLTTNDSVYSLATSPNRRLLGVGANATVQLWSVDRPAKLISSQPIELGVSGIAFSPDGRAIAAGLGDGSVRVFGVGGGPAAAVLRGHSSPVAAVIFPSNDRVVSVSTDASARIWDWTHAIPTKLAVNPLPYNGGIRVDGPDAVTIVDTSGRVSRWTKTTGVRSDKVTGSDSSGAAAISRDGDLLLHVAGDGSTVVARDTSGAVVATSAITGTPWMAAIHPSDRRFAIAADTGSADGQVLEFDAGTSAKPRIAIRRSSPAQAVAYAPSGDLLAGGFQNGEVLVKRPGATAERLGAHEGGVYDMTFSPDARWLATSSADRTVRIWDVQTGRAAHVLRGHTREIQGVSFSDDGRMVISASADGLRFWDWARELTLVTMPLQPPGALEVATNGPAPDVAYYEGSTVFVSRCDVCGSLTDVNTLAQSRTTRELTAAERSSNGITGSP